jgi:steroid delta-isomerase-like uncharacterized protein
MADKEIMVVRRWFEEVWNQGRVELMDELLAADAPVHDISAPGDIVLGPAGFRPAYEKLRGAFPDIRFTIDEAISERDLVAARWTARMTHRGDQLGVPATNQPVTVSGISFVRVRDGKAVEAWNSWDMMGLMQQIGQITQAAVVPSDDTG